MGKRGNWTGFIDGGSRGSIAGLSAGTTSMMWGVGGSMQRLAHPAVAVVKFREDKLVLDHIELLVGQVRQTTGQWNSILIRAGQVVPAAGEGDGERQGLWHALDGDVVPLGAFHLVHLGGRDHDEGAVEAKALVILGETDLVLGIVIF